jgi:hypothetical protein
MGVPELRDFWTVTEDALDRPFQVESICILIRPTFESDLFSK